MTTSIPALLDQCRQQYPHLTLELLPTLENDPALEDIVVERLEKRGQAPASMPRSQSRFPSG